MKTSGFSSPVTQCWIFTLAASLAYSYMSVSFLPSLYFFSKGSLPLLNPKSLHLEMENKFVYYELLLYTIGKPQVYPKYKACYTPCIMKYPL